MNSLTARFAQMRQGYGDDSLARVEEMLRHPRRGRPAGQRDARWVLPGVSGKPWHDISDYPDISALTAALTGSHDALYAEYERARLEEAGSFQDYRHYLGSQDGWKSGYVYNRGHVVGSARRAHPMLVDLLEKYAVANNLLCRLLECHFSILGPGVHIGLHADLWNFSINFHYAFAVPDGDCGITVDGETRRWTERQGLLFDYSYLHEAWNRTDSPRVCLLADLWHPEVTPAERIALTAIVDMFRAGESAAS